MSGASASSEAVCHTQGTISASPLLPPGGYPPIRPGAATCTLCQFCGTWGSRQNLVVMVVHLGVPPHTAAAGVVLVHGRGATAESILQLGRELNIDEIAYLAPQAKGNTWYPHSFLAPLDANEPGITNGIAAIMRCVSAFEEAGLPRESIAIIGFSQGACLACETVARNAARYGGLAALSGGLIGNGEIPGAEPPADKAFDYSGSLGGTPVFIGCSDIDPHIPVERVYQTADVFRGLGAEVELRIYKGMGHTVNRDELSYLRGMLEALVAARFPRE